MDWAPKTLLGKMVKEGKITTINQALESKMPLREPEIVDVLLPNLEDQVLDVKMVQRMTDSGRRVKFRITVVIGNSNGFIGLGQMKGTEVGPTIRKAIDNAKLNIIQVRRGCGSWECGCWQPHSVPFEVTGRSGSTIVTLKPAPRGVALAAGDTAKHILRLAGIKDIWISTKGQTRTTINFAKATFDALRKTAETKVMKQQIEKLKIISGSVELPEEVREGEKIEELKIEKEGTEEKKAEGKGEEEKKMEEKEKSKEITEEKGSEKLEKKEKVEEKVTEEKKERSKEKGKELGAEEEKIKEEKKTEEKIEGKKKEIEKKESKETDEKKEPGKLEEKLEMKEKEKTEEKKTKEKNEVKEEEKSKEVERKKEKEKTEEKKDNVEKVEE